MIDINNCVFQDPIRKMIGELKRLRIETGLTLSIPVADLRSSFPGIVRILGGGFGIFLVMFAPFDDFF